MRRPAVAARRTGAAIGESCLRCAAPVLALDAAWSVVRAIGRLWNRRLSVLLQASTSHRQKLRKLRRAKVRSQSRAASFGCPPEVRIGVNREVYIGATAGCASARRLAHRRGGLRIGTAACASARSAGCVGAALCGRQSGLARQATWITTSRPSPAIRTLRRAVCTDPFSSLCLKIRNQLIQVVSNPRWMAANARQRESSTRQAIRIVRARMEQTTILLTI